MTSPLCEAFDELCGKTMYYVRSSKALCQRWSVKILGIFDRTARSNYNPIIENIKVLLNNWREKVPSLAGCICILKTMVISKLIYCISVLPTPYHSILRLCCKSLYGMESKTGYFLWSNMHYCNIPRKPKKGIIWTEASIQWCMLNYNPESGKRGDILDQSLCCNIQICGKIIFFSNWSKAGMQTLADLCDG